MLRALAREQGVAEAFVDELQVGWRLDKFALCWLLFYGGLLSQAGQGITAAFDENIARVSESVIQASKVIA